MRAAISWGNEENNVVVRGYATWNYFSILAFAVFMLFASSRVEGNLCSVMVFFACILLCTTVYMYQLPHFQSIGTKVADYLSSDKQE
jgi:hypothetical protein